MIADDHALFRDGLRRLPGVLAADIEIDESRDFAETADALKGCQDFDLLLLDLRMPGMSGHPRITVDWVWR